ncbi:AbrB/MazE/SpoVT family DNA-binding domain-containing protein [Candidatus Pacearchaeota archaeon]|nr:AbrB/MazE/SpoVT family DNA-binding domain-containing protein [Candidatus Pacearchaeota archaeon]
MEQINVKVKKWGNSFGVVLPIRIVEKERLKEGSEITLTMQSRKKMTVGDLMRISKELGLDKALKDIDTQKALREVDKAFWPEDE